MKRLPLILLIAIPATSVLMGIITMILAFSGPSQEIPIREMPLNKTSWQVDEASRPVDEASGSIDDG